MTQCRISRRHGPPEGSARVRVRFLPDPSVWRWCWDIVDQGSDRVIESSWSGHWMAYDSQAEALRAGHLRLAEVGRLAEECAAGRSPSLAARRRHLVIVARDAPGLQGWLTRRLGSTPGIEVIVDRRDGQGLEGKPRVTVERRRRSDVDAELQERGWSIVCLCARGRHRRLSLA